MIYWTVCFALNACEVIINIDMLYADIISRYTCHVVERVWCLDEAEHFCYKYYWCT